MAERTPEEIAAGLSQRDMRLLAAFCRTMANEARSCAIKRAPFDTGDRLEQFADSMDLDYDGDDVDIARECVRVAVLRGEADHGA